VHCYGARRGGRREEGVGRADEQQRMIAASSSLRRHRFVLLRVERHRSTDCNLSTTAFGGWRRALDAKIAALL